LPIVATIKIGASEKGCEHIKGWAFGGDEQRQVED